VATGTGTDCSNCLFKLAVTNWTQVGNQCYKPEWMQHVPGIKRQEEWPQVWILSALGLQIVTQRR